MPESHDVPTSFVRPIADLREILDRLASDLDGKSRRMVEARPDLALIAYQAQWHMRGCLFHMRALQGSYERFAGEVGARVHGHAVPPDMVVMHTPALQESMFSFYALVNLAKITLDNLRIYLRPVFQTDFRQLPKSLSDFLASETDCPVYRDLAAQPVAQYLNDLRNCLVHYRSFATSDNVIVVSEHVSADRHDELLGTDGWSDGMARASFRLEGQKVVVNVLVPDTIFDRFTTEKLARFTYNERHHLLSQAREFVYLIHHVLAATIALLINPGVPTYTYK